MLLHKKKECIGQLIKKIMKSKLHNNTHNKNFDYILLQTRIFLKGFRIQIKTRTNKMLMRKIILGLIIITTMTIFYKKVS